MAVIRHPYALTHHLVAATATVALLLAASVAGAAPCSARGGTTTAPPALRAKLQEMVEADGASGVTALVLRDGRLLYRLDVGKVDPAAPLPIASASKWLTAALVMTVVDEGKLSLDEPIGRRLPAFTGAAGTITLRQLLSFTSGQGSLRAMTDLRQSPRITLTEAVQQIAAQPLEDPPGTVFRYGSPALQVAGALAEQATGATWAALFDQRIGRPLGMTHTSWTHPLSPRIAPARVRNPNLQGGVVTTAEDYARFLTMLACDGVYAGRRILSPDALETLETAQTLNTPKAYLPPGAPAGIQYALGNWCETVAADGRCTLVSSPGALGTYPWIDRASGLYGVFFMHHRLPRVAEDIREARRIIIDAAAAGDEEAP